MELLVVIGIIAMLASILLPALSRARENASQVYCLGNMRQLGAAFQMYTQANQDQYPACAADTATKQMAEDWVYWDAPRRPISGHLYGRLAPYLTSSSDRVMICPSDDLAAHSPGPGSTMGVYPYSYSVNWLICFGHTGRVAPGKQTLLATTAFRTAQVNNPSEKILLVDEDYLTIDDGTWAPDLSLKNNQNVLSIRHDRMEESTTNRNAGRGNALFCDDHAEFILRADTLLPEHYDPTVP